MINVAKNAMTDTAVAKVAIQNRTLRRSAKVSTFSARASMSILLWLVWSWTDASRIEISSCLLILLGLIALVDLVVFVVITMGVVWVGVGNVENYFYKNAVCETIS